MSRPARFTRRAGQEIEEALRAMQHDTARKGMRAAVETAAKSLGANPYLGRPCTAPLLSSYRFWSLTRFSYVLIYDPAKNPVEILRCVHTRRDLPRALAELHGLPEP